MLSSSNKLVLASSSPRRKELLEGLGFDLDIISPQCEEIQEEGETPEDYTLRNSKLKAKWVEEHLAQSGRYKDIKLPIIAADTIVVLGNKVLEKPKSRSDAINMLKDMSGKTHTVITGFTVMQTGAPTSQCHSELVKTEVTISHLSTEEIEAYVDTKEPMDKAGSYAIQGRGGYMVQQISGSYSNVVGLPLAELIKVLREKC